MAQPVEQHIPSYYLFPHHIVLGHIGLWTIAELAAARVWPIRASCKKISLLHCILAFTLSSAWLVRHFFFYNQGDHESDDATTPDHHNDYLPLYNFAKPGTWEHHIIFFSMAYFIVDMPFCLAFHRTFILHHVLCILAFGAIQGYWRYLPKSNPLYMDFMAWDTTPGTLGLGHDGNFDGEEGDRLPKMQLLMGGMNGVFNLWMAELGGVFFHINRAFQDTDMELPSRGLFLFMFVLTRCCIWPLYLWHLYASQAELQAQQRTSFHEASIVLETGLFLTNLHFLYKNIAPIYKAGRILPDKPAGFHRKWFDDHPNWKRFVGLFIAKDKMSMPSKSTKSDKNNLVGDNAVTSSSKQQKKND